MLTLRQGAGSRPSTGGGCLALQTGPSARRNPLPAHLKGESLRVKVRLNGLMSLVLQHFEHTCKLS